MKVLQDDGFKTRRKKAISIEDMALINSMKQSIYDLAISQRFVRYFE